MSSLSVRSSPIRTISPQPQGQSVLSGSTTCSIRSRCSGKWPRLRSGRGFLGARGGDGSPAAASASTSADAPSRSSNASWRSSADSFSDRLPWTTRCNSCTRCSRRRILEANALSDRTRLQKLPARALLDWRAEPWGRGFMTVRCSPGQSRLALHVMLVGDRAADFGVYRAAALVLMVDPARRSCIDPARVAAMLGLTPSECKIRAHLMAIPAVFDRPGSAGGVARRRSPTRCFSSGTESQFDFEGP